MANDIIGNNIAKARPTFQFIGDTQLATNKQMVETWKLLWKIDMGGASLPLGNDIIFKGFNWLNVCSWLGFHDGCRT